MSNQKLCALGDSCIAGEGRRPAPASDACPWGRCAFHCAKLHRDQPDPHPEHLREVMVREWRDVLTVASASDT